MKQPHSTLSEMYKIIKCTNHNKHELKECCKPKLTEQLLVTPFDTEWTHHRTTPINNISQSFTFKHTNGLRGRLQGTSHQSIWNNYIILSQWTAYNSKWHKYSHNKLIKQHNMPFQNLVIWNHLLIGHDKTMCIFSAKMPLMNSWGGVFFYMQTMK